MNVHHPVISTPRELGVLAAEKAETLWQLPDAGLLLLVVGGIALLLLLVVKAKLHAFVALLIVSAAVGLGAGVRPTELPGLLEAGMGATLSEIAIIVALGAMLGRMMQDSGAAQVLSQRLLDAFGERRAPLAVGLTALIFGIPVFFDVGFIILLPLIYAVAARSGRSVISVALPAVGGLAIMHAVLPPHPGPVAAAGLLGASLGWVAVMGLVCGLPAWYVGAYLFGTRIGDRLGIPVPRTLFADAGGPHSGGDDAAGSGAAGSDDSGGTGSTAAVGTGGTATPGDGTVPRQSGGTATGTDARPSGAHPLPATGAVPPGAPSLATTVLIIVLPVLMIMLQTFASVVLPEGPVRETLEFVGDPVVALIVSVLLSFWVLGLRGGAGMEKIEKAASASLGPVALVLLVTGAGGVFGEVLEVTGAGQALADLLDVTSLPVIVLAFLIAVALRVALGSKTVAIVTTAPIVAPMISEAGLSQPEIALIVVAVAAGGTVLSHVNDSGFWLFNRYMDLDIRTTLKTWTLMETFMGGAAFLIAAGLSTVLAVV